MTIGQKLKRLRKDQKWTAEELARRSGLHKHSISHWETDRRRPSPYNLFLLAKALGVSLDAFRDCDARDGRTN